MKRNEIPGPALERLSLLYRLLGNPADTGGKPVSSGKLGELTGIPPHTIRKDISYLGEETGKGSGYDPERLRNLIAQILGTGIRRKACVAGLGRLGSAILFYGGFAGSEYSLAAGFDVSRNRMELLRTDVPLYPVSELEQVIRREGIELGIIAVPEQAARDVAGRMIQAGIRGIINFAPVVIHPDRKGIFIRNVSVLGELTVLSALLSVHDGQE